MIRPDPNVRSTTSADGAVLLNARTGIVFKINPVGAQIWKIIEQGANKEQIISSLVQTFPIPSTQIEEDTTKFLNQLKEKRLIRDD